jgi:hypothetical protein
MADSRQEVTMRAVWMAAGVLVALGGTAPAQPVRQVQREYKWCHVEPPYYMPHCRFHSIEECRIEIPGLGGYCNLNPRYVEPPPRPARPPKRKRAVR